MNEQIKSIVASPLLLGCTISYPSGPLLKCMSLFASIFLSVSSKYSRVLSVMRCYCTSSRLSKSLK